MIPIAYNMRNLRVRKTTSAATALGLALVVFVFSSVMMLANGLDKTAGRAAGADIAIVLRKGSTGEMESGVDEPNVGLIAASPEVARYPSGKPQSVAELIVVMLLDKSGTTGFSNVQMRGVPDDVMQFRPTVHIMAGRAATPGTDEVIIGKGIRGRFKGLDLDQTFEMRKNRPAKVVGVFEDQGSAFESEIWADLHTVRNTFGRDGIVSSVRVRLESPSKFAGFKASIESNRQLNVAAMKDTEYYEKASQGTSKFLTVMGILIAVFFSIGAMIGAMITMHAAVAQRQREIGTLRALGFSRGSILFSFLLESIVLALIGGAIGAIASLAMGFVRISTMNMATWSEIVFAFEPTVGIIAGSMLLAAVMGLLGGFFPAVRAARINPVLAMRGA